MDLQCNFHDECPTHRENCSKCSDTQQPTTSKSEHYEPKQYSTNVDYSSDEEDYRRSRRTLAESEALKKYYEIQKSLMF